MSRQLETVLDRINKGTLTPSQLKFFADSYGMTVEELENMAFEQRMQVIREENSVAVKFCFFYLIVSAIVAMIVSYFLGS